MSNRIFSHPFYLFISVPDFKFLRKQLLDSSFFIFSHTYHKYTSTTTFFENVYTISKEAFTEEPDSCTLISQDILRNGIDRGNFLVYIHWLEKEEDRGSLIEFLNKNNYSLKYLGSTPDWLGHPIYKVKNKGNHHESS